MGLSSSLKDWLGRGRTPPRLSTGSHHGGLCDDNVLAASGARPSSTTHYSPGVISSSRPARRLVEREAHGVQVCVLRERERERERDGQRDRESEEKTCNTVLASPLTISVPFPFHSDCIRNHLYCAHRPPACASGCQLARVLHASVVPAACVLVSRVSEREREKSQQKEVITPSAETLGRSSAEHTVA